MLKNDDISLSLISYHDENLNFSIDYPEKWEIIDPNEDIAFAVKKADDSQKFIHITVLDDSVNDEVNLRKIVEENYKELADTFDNFIVDEVVDLHVNKNSAIKLKVKFDADSTTLQSLLYFIKTSNRVYLLALTSNSVEFFYYEKIYEYIANTFNAE